MAIHALSVFIQYILTKVQHWMGYLPQNACLDYEAWAK